MTGRLEASTKMERGMDTFDDLFPVFPGERRHLYPQVLPPHIVHAVLTELIADADLIQTADCEFLLCPLSRDALETLAIFDDLDGQEPDDGCEPDVDDEPDDDDEDWRKG